MNRATQVRALRQRIRWIIEETPKRAKNKGGKPWHLSRVKQAYAARTADGLAEYVRDRIADPEGSEGFHALTAQGCWDLTFEAMILDEDAPFYDLPEFIQVRHVARRRAREVQNADYGQGLMKLYLVQDYAGGMRIRYEGKYQHVATQRIRDAGRAGWPASGFVIVRAGSRAEAWEKAEPLLLARKGRGPRR